MPADVILVSMDVTSLYTNTPQEEAINTVFQENQDFYDNKPPIPVGYPREMLSLILKENSFQFDGKDYLQTHGTAMGTKMAVLVLLTFLRPTLRKRSLDREPINRYCGKDSSMACFHCGT